MTEYDQDEAVDYLVGGGDVLSEILSYFIVGVLQEDYSALERASEHALVAVNKWIELRDEVLPSARSERTD